MHRFKTCRTVIVVKRWKMKTIRNFLLIATFTMLILFGVSAYTSLNLADTGFSTGEAIYSFDKFDKNKVELNPAFRNSDDRSFTGIFGEGIIANGLDLVDEEEVEEMNPYCYDVDGGFYPEWPGEVVWRLSNGTTGNNVESCDFDTGLLIEYDCINDAAVLAEYDCADLGLECVSAGWSGYSFCD